MRREDMQEREMRGKETHRPCDFLLLPSSFLSSAHTTWCPEGSVEEKWTNLKTFAHNLSLSIPCLPPTRCLSHLLQSLLHLMYLPPIENWLTNCYSFHFCFVFSLHLSYSHIYCLFIFSPLCPPVLSSGTCISLQVLQGTQRGVVKAAASPRTAASLVAKGGASEGQQHQSLWHLYHQLKYAS